MPYIKQDRRHQLDPHIDAIVSKLVNMKLDDETNLLEGNLNYIITRILMKAYGDKDSTHYAEVNSAIGMLECCKLEFYRKIAAPFEDQKEFENGAVEINPTQEVVGTVNVVDPRSL